nr:cytochrome P450 [Tanacetum cinerariifolium]
MSLLLNHPNAMKKIKNEIDTQVGTRRLLQEDDLEKLSYLQNAINESLGLCPTLPMLLPHEAPQDTKIGGYFVPSGTMLMAGMSSNQFRVSGPRFNTWNFDSSIRMGEDMGQTVPPECFLWLFHGKIDAITSTFFGVHGLLDGTFVSTSDNASDWKKLDSLVKVWIYGTIYTPLLQTVLKKNVEAKDVWKSLADLFHNHTKTPLTLLETRSMLLLEESRLSRKQGRDNARDTTSSTVLLASHNSAHNKGSTNKDLCRNFQHGSCRFGEHCKYSHTNPTGARNGNNNNRGSAAHWNNPTGRVLHGHRVTFSPTRPGSMTYAPNQNRGMHNNMHGGNMWSGSPIPNGSRGILGSAPSNEPQVAFGPTGVQNPTSQANYYWGPHVVYGPDVDQATSLPQAFNAMTVQDYGDSGWYMDTDATAHIASDAGPMDPPPAPPM